MFNLKKDKGFTLIELLIVSTIIVILSSMVLLNYRSGKEGLALRRSINRLAQDIRRVGSMAGLDNPGCTPFDKFGYGIYFNTGISETSYIIFADCNGDGKYNTGADVTLETIEFEEGIVIGSLKLGKGANSPGNTNKMSIIFDPPDPIISLGKVITAEMWDLAIVYLAPENDLSNIKSVSVNKAGLIDID